MAQRLCFLFFNVISVTAVSSLDSRSCCSHQRYGSEEGARERNSTEGQSLAPQDVSLHWISDFEPRLSWKAPPHLPKGCCFSIKVNSTRSSQMLRCPMDTNYTGVYFTKDGALNMSIQTVCDKVTSEPVKKINIYPELVTDLDCYILSRNLIRCTWSPVPGAPPSTFFYRSQYINGSMSNLRPCPKVYTDSKRSVCDLQISHSYFLAVLFNGTVGNKTVRNTFKKDLEIKPSFKSWTVTLADGKFYISWVIANDTDSSGWEFTVLYKECAESGSSDVINNKYNHAMDRLPSCRYCFAINASAGKRNTQTGERCFDADPDSFLLAAIIVPLTCVALAVLALVCWIRNKDSIFPPIPKPRDLLSDISDNNNKTQFESIYFPSEVEELFKITLVTDSPNDKQKL